MVQTIIGDLVDAHILSETESQGNEAAAYQPALDINKLSLKYIINALERKGIDHIPLPRTDTSEALEASLQKFSDALEAHPANCLLKDI